MGRYIAFAIGGLLIVLGAIALLGAVELVGAGSTAEAVAQAFLVPAALFLIGGFVIYMGLGARKR